ncbi:hypothetical protein POTOM_033451 [Populus tomentosa]|uniref:Uncharacterized protein n=1 Tax=Populus tomentosa TaxID=118781 RepID=A0A8X8CQN9_POPTO|nr:hypothetical protein POTOM_033451 [Populus tomentosa]
MKMGTRSGFWMGSTYLFMEISIPSLISSWLSIPGTTLSLILAIIPSNMLSLQESLGARVTWPSCATKKARSLSTVKKIPQSLGLAGHRISVRMVGLCSLLFLLSVLSINLIHRTWESFSQRRRPGGNFSPSLK